MSEAKAGRPFAPFEWKLAGRYLRSRRKEAFISVIAGFALRGPQWGWVVFNGVIGIALGVIATSGKSPTGR